MPRLYRQRDVRSALLRGRRVAILGFGAQGEAQALNLRDSGVEVVVGLRARSPRRRAARAAGLAVRAPAEASAHADLVMLLVPDEAQGSVWRAVSPRVRPDAALGFSHGLAFHFGLVKPPRTMDVILVAPKGPGKLLRERYRAGRGLPALAAVGQDASGRAWSLALAYAGAIGCARAGVLRTTFRVEAVTDLFGEQAVLTGGMAELARAAYETLVEAGYPPEIAYVECVQEIQGLADLLYRRGIAGMREVVSSPARWAGVRAGRRVVDASARRRLRALLREVESGAAVRWLRRLPEESRRTMARSDREARIERTGRWVRRNMGWLEEDP